MKFSYAQSVTPDTNQTSLIISKIKIMNKEAKRIVPTDHLILEKMKQVILINLNVFI